MLYLQKNMAKFVRVICCLLFAMALYATANDASAGRSAEEALCADAISLHGNEMQAALTTARTPYLPDAELAGVGMQVQQVPMSRVLRINVLGHIFSVKSISQKLADRDAMLSQHWCRLYETTTHYCCHPVSEYYVFALRHIIV